MRKKTNEGGAWLPNPGFKILLARRKIWRYALLFAFFMIVPPLSSLFLFGKWPKWNELNDSSNLDLFILHSIFFAPFPILISYLIFDHYFLTSYIVEGYLKFESDRLEYQYQKKVWDWIDYQDIARLEINYVAYERISYFGYANRTSGADNTLDIIYRNGEKIHCNFLCKRRGNITKIKRLLLFLKNTKGIEIIYSEKGKISNV